MADTSHTALKYKIGVFAQGLPTVSIQMNIDIFCHVVDNFGDAGFSLRLGRDLNLKGHAVRLFCSDTGTARKISNPDDALEILPFEELDNYSAASTDVLLSAFSYRFSDAIAHELSTNHVLCINLEYFSAEKWVEDCHGLPSPHQGLDCHFFFQGISSRTGGFIIEDSFRRKAARADKAPAGDRRITVFSYPNPDISQLFHALGRSFRKSVVYVFEGLALDNLNAQLHTHITPEKPAQFGNATVKAAHMVSQDEYDDMLLESSFNLVRGEDSIVRAMLSGRPFLWQIYPQDENVHLTKLNSLFDRFEELFPGSIGFIKRLRPVFLAYNGSGDALGEISDFDGFEQEFAEFAKQLQAYLLSQKSYTDNLLEFCAERIR